MNIEMKDIEEFQKHFVTPLVQAVEQKLDDKLAPLVKKGTDQDAAMTDLQTRTKRLENNQAKALVGYSVLVSGVTLILAGLKNWLYYHVGSLFK